MSSLNANTSASGTRSAGLTSDFTIGAWVRCNQWSGSQFQTVLFLTDGNKEAYWTFETSADRCQYYLYNGASVTGPSDIIADAAPAGWIYAAISRTGSTLKIRAIKSGTTTITTATTQGSWSGTLDYYVFGSTYAGQCEDVDATRLRVFSSELSDAQLLAEAQSDTPVLSVYANYPLTAVSGWQNDASGNARHLTATGTPVFVSGQPSDIATGPGTDVLTANDLSAVVALDSPALGQVHVLSANELNISVALDTPSLSTTGTDVLTANDLSASIELDSPALGQVHSLGANDLSVSVELDTPTLSGPLLKIFIVGSSVATGYIDNVPTYSEYALGRSLGLSYIRSDTETVNAAIEGVDNWWLAARYTTDVLPYFDPTKRNIIIHWELNNSDWAGGPTLPQGDPATIVGEIEDYADIAHSDGFEVLVCTSPPVDYAPEETNLNLIDALLRSSTVFDGLIDLHTIADFYPPGWPGNPNYIDDVHLLDPGQILVRDFTSTYLDSYVNGTINNLSADDLSASVVLDSPALGQIHVLSANDLNASAVLDTPALGQIHALSADDLSSSVVLDSPALSLVYALSSNDLSTSVVLDSPALNQVHVLSANDLSSSVEQDSPALGQVHALSAVEISASVELDSPALNQVHALSANDLSTSVELDNPGLGTEGVHALSADDLNTSVALDSPALGQVHSLNADDLSMATGLDSPALGQVHALSVNALTLSTALDSPALNVIHALGANDLVISVLLDSPELSTSTHVLVATDLVLSVALASPALGQIHSLSADDLNISIWLDSPALGFGGTDRIYAVTYVHEPGQKLSYTWSRNQ